MNKRTKNNIITAVVLFLLVFLLGLGFLDRGHEWGDDFAAYMLEAKAIADGTMDEQIYINRKIHASPMGFGGNEIPDTLTYVWGYPLALSAVYKIVGYDPVQAGIPIAYKLPNLIAYAGFVSIVFLFYRRQLTFVVSLFLSLLFALNLQMLSYVNLLMSDVFCLTLCVAALLLADSFFHCNTAKKKAGIGVLLGAVLWYNYEVRLNGVTVIAVVMFAHALHLLRTRTGKKDWAVQLTPYLSLVILLGISACLMPQATSNTNHIASGPNRWIINNVKFYNDIIRDWICQMIPRGLPLRRYAHYVVYVLAGIGVLYAGILKNLHLTALMIGTVAVLLLLPYTQPIRYLFNALPLFLMFAAYGVCFVWTKVQRKIGKRLRTSMRYAGYLMMLLCVIHMATDVTREITAHVRAGAMECRHGAYSEDAADLYRFIRDHTDEADMIAFIKPRALTLNTGRICFVPGINGNSFHEMDYYVSFGMEDYLIDEMGSDMWNRMVPVHRNDSFVVYQAN